MMHQQIERCATQFKKVAKMAPQNPQNIYCLLQDDDAQSYDQTHHLTCFTRLPAVFLVAPKISPAMIASSHKQKSSWSNIHPGRLTWNLKMMVWKMIFLFNWVLFRFHVNLSWCNIQPQRSTLPETELFPAKWTLH